MIQGASVEELIFYTEFKSPFLKQIEGNLEGDYLAIYQKLSSGFFSIYPCLLIFNVSKSRPFDDTLECKQDINAHLKNLSVLNFQLTECKKKTNNSLPPVPSPLVKSPPMKENKYLSFRHHTYSI